MFFSKLYKDIQVKVNIFELNYRMTPYIALIFDETSLQRLYGRYGCVVRTTVEVAPSWCDTTHRCFDICIWISFFRRSLPPSTPARSSHRLLRAHTKNQFCEARKISIFWFFLSRIFRNGTCPLLLLLLLRLWPLHSRHHPTLHHLKPAIDQRVQGNL